MSNEPCCYWCGRARVDLRSLVRHWECTDVDTCLTARDADSDDAVGASIAADEFRARVAS